MLSTSESMELVIEHFASLPTIGRKTAQRLTYYLLRQKSEFVQNFSEALINLNKNVKYCSVCYNYTETDPCPICSSEKRNNTIICVVEEPSDIVAIEKTGEYRGLYHVLHGALNPLDGINASDLKIQELISRTANINEVILAINSSVEGEVTTQYIARLLKPLNIKVTRLARGIPIGSELEFTDEATLTKALECRIEV
jgi:recombination protein RecR